MDKTKKQKKISFSIPDLLGMGFKWTGSGTRYDIYFEGVCIFHDVDRKDRFSMQKIMEEFSYSLKLDILHKMQNMLNVEER